MTSSHFLLFSRYVTIGKCLQTRVTTPGLKDQPAATGFLPYLMYLIMERDM